MSSSGSGESTATSEHPPAAWAAALYYRGTPSAPKFVASTAGIVKSRWAFSHFTGFDGDIPRKRLLPIVDHPLLHQLWESSIAPAVLEVLNELDSWTSVDWVRIEVEEDVAAPANVLWIGVLADSLECLEVLQSFGVFDVEVEIRESVVVFSGGPPLLDPLPEHPIADYRHPFTHALGLPISAATSPDMLGTGAFFLREGDESNSLLLVTARHVVLGSKCDVEDPKNLEYDGNGSEVLLGDFNNSVKRLEEKIKHEEDMIQSRKLELANIPNTPRYERARANAAHLLRNAEDNWPVLRSTMLEVKTWEKPSNRIIGQVVYSPAFQYGGSASCSKPGFTQDLAVIRADPTKFPADIVNRLELGWEMTDITFRREMDAAFVYPEDRQLRVEGTIPLAEVLDPNSEGPQEDKDAGKSFKVIKNGAKTGVTIGVATKLWSFTRRYGADQKPLGTSKELPVLRCYPRSLSGFSDGGDSGSVVVDGRGRIAGMITSGSTRCLDASRDITYVTPIDVVLKGVKERFPDAVFPEPAEPMFPEPAEPKLSLWKTKALSASVTGIAVAFTAWMILYW
ncbi:hypothetical protein C8F01DRAFT_981794 [Mycena amicta]|nr:hypothetical protein C8F01DRAFT_981794 [Mycena amicta]